MNSATVYFILEAVAAFSIVVGVHALRRKTTLVYSYVVLAFMRLASWAATPASLVSVGPLTLGVGSNVFFSAVLLGVFLLYVADGRRAGRVAIAVVVGTGLLYAWAAVMLHAQFPLHAHVMFPDSGLRANLGSIAASLLDLVLLGVVWEVVQRGSVRVPLALKVFATLAAVLVADALVYVAIARAGGPGFRAELLGNLLSRVLVAAVVAPFVSLYLAFEVRRYGLDIGPRSMLSILLKEDVERELVSTRHQLRLGTEALWESEERYRRIVDDVPIMVFRFSADGRLTYTNRALCAYYGRDARELLGISVLTPIDPEEHELLWTKVRALTPTSPTAQIMAHATPSQGPHGGQRRVQRWVIRGIFSPHGGGLAYQAVGEDVTRETDLEARLTQARRMEAIGRLAGGVANDFNNLISVIWSCAEAASGRLAQLPPEVARALTGDLMDIRGCTDRAELLTRQLLAVSQQQVVEPRALDLSTVVTSLAPLMRRMLPAGIALELRCESGVPAVVMDPIQVERVIMNLVGNARDAMQAGGSLVIATRQEIPSDTYLDAHPEARPGAHALLVVTDGGVGMDRENCGRIFEPFFTARGEERSAGLGLSTVYGIVQQAGGHVRVESTVGAGTSFFVYLPAGPEPMATTTTAPIPASAGAASGGSILYCESDEGVRAQVGQLLENAGYQVTYVSGSAEALDLAASPATAPPSVLLADMVTSGMTGEELARGVRRYYPTLPAVLFTGKVVEREPRTDALAFWYVNKRHGPSALLAAIREAIRRAEKDAGGARASQPSPTP